VGAVLPGEDNADGTLDIGHLAGILALAFDLQRLLVVLERAVQIVLSLQRAAEVEMGGGDAARQPGGLVGGEDLEVILDGAVVLADPGVRVQVGDGVQDVAPAPSSFRATFNS
jgi:hypothetical protein